jgi:hypothetical protein
LEESQPRGYEELRDTVRGDSIAYGLVEDLDIPEVQRNSPACSRTDTLLRLSGASTAVF